MTTDFGRGMMAPASIITLVMPPCPLNRFYLRGFFFRADFFIFFLLLFFVTLAAVSSTPVRRFSLKSAQGPLELVK